VKVRKVLVANRGEIAVRVFRTCRAMGIATVAVHSEADRGAAHTRAADEVVEIGPAEAAKSYLSFDAVLEAARRTGADAIHPGYGFLSQNGDFADAVAGAGLTFIGPPGDVHRRMGDKQGARRLMAAAGVPVVPGYDGDDQSAAALAAEAARIGWPVLIKPSRGGGGKGMRIVRLAADFDDALAAARRESKGAFGTEAVVLEKFVEVSRHVEVQVLADEHGATIHLLERECSIQRRHQKVVEESPSPALTPLTREGLCAAGVAAARAAGYRNAGTVEFLMAPDGAFYFLEMNTRLQVEHPVTEAILGLDIVRMQIEVASGLPLPLAQGDVVGRGHALECRLYAEDPSRDHMPSPGRVLHFAPPDGPGVRCDGGVATGTEITTHYDPLLAKVITWGRDRAESIAKMEDALARTAILGPVTNLALLRAIVAHPAFRAGELNTSFLDTHLTSLPAPACPPPRVLAAAVAAAGTRTARGSARATAAPDPWSRAGGWRMGAS
jgi:3-methylcrotonyl-CoA carboxylase alpha subunit